MHHGELFQSKSASPACDLYARVALETGLDERGGTLTYANPDGRAEAGSLVECPLGPRRVRGVVVEVGGPELLEGLDPGRARAILSVEREIRLPGVLLELARWLSDYYACPLGMTLASMVPAAVKKSVGVRAVTLIERGEPLAQAVKMTPAARAIIEKIDSLAESPFPIEARTLARRLGLKSTAAITRLVSLGVLREVSAERVSTREVHRAEAQIDAVGPERPVLTEDQSAVIEGIGLQLGGFGTHLLHGVTGSGKTEVYLGLIEKVAAGGKAALVLVPEIALTPQTSRRFAQRLGHLGVAVLHSGLTQAERHRQWRRAASGEARVIVGARSAVFAPIDGVGIIIVDEEHDGSYKQDQLPRYHARDVAIVRARLEDAPIVLGSATPSLESWHNAALGRATLWSLPDRVGGGALPTVELASVLDEPRGPGGQLPTIGSRLAHALTETLSAGGQAIILQNRRGFAAAVACRKPSCGWRLQCQACDASMVLHRGRDLPRGSLVRCHHCLAEQLVPGACPSCAGPITTIGVGTQRVEEELAARFGLVLGKELVRVDSDTMRSGRDYFDALDRFGAGEIRVLLGTQMIAKGLDYPNVRLVGVVSADTGLSMPDFRAAERTFQLVSQVAGRAGRAEHAGLVIVQTMQPDDPAIALAARHDYVGFATRELAIRQKAGLPPATRMVRVVCRDESEEKASGRAREIATALRQTGLVDVEQPGPCAVARIAGQVRYEVIATAASAGRLREALRGLRLAGLAISDARTAIDVDPIALL